MNRKIKSFKQKEFLSEQYAVSKVTLPQAHNRFCHSSIALSTIRCWKSAQTSAVRGVSSRQCCYANHAACSKPI